MQDKKVYATMEEAEADQVLCEACGLPTLSLLGSYLWNRPPVYFLEPCDVVPCRLHCQCRQGDIKPA